MSSRSQLTPYSPIVLALVLAGGILIGSQLKLKFRSDPDSVIGITLERDFDKISEVINYIDHEYVDPVSREELVDQTINHLLQQLDPHSYYISAAEAQAANESLEGNFEGIGVQFTIQQDTVVVISPISGGPSEKVGIRSGDRIVEANGELIAGVGITNSRVIELLKGQAGTEVNVKVFRRGSEEQKGFTIVRDKIPIFSVDAAYLLDETTGYIKVNKFSKATYDEFMNATQQLKAKGISNLVLDLRGNGGGYLDAATRMIDEFLPANQLIVYTEGRSSPRKVYNSTGDGDLVDVKLAVLIDEGSASASEIVAGAIQDNDRGVLVGRRSFGKGLVQEQTRWEDGSETRLTIARYYTPTGRCIQKPYGDGVEKYYSDFYDRVNRGETGEPEDVDFPDSLKFTTPKGKVVYGGGGILPDRVVPVDTTSRSFFLTELSYRGIIRQYAFDYTDDNRQELEAIGDLDQFLNTFSFEGERWDEFMAYAEERGIKPDSGAVEISGDLIRNQLLALVAENLYKKQGFFRVINTRDVVLEEAMNALKRHR